MRKWLLAGIIVIAFLLRVVALDRFPVGFTPDEASFGYDAYSILKTGKDQWGHSYPLVLESFGDFKPPLYAYLTIPFVWLLGLTKVAVRLPNALLGTLSVYVVYLLVGELRKLSYKKLEIGNKRSLALRAWKLEILAAALLVVSPWHIMMSRGAFEANLTTFFLPLGVYLFLKGLKDSRFLVWSSLALGLNLFTYHSTRLVTPLIVAVLLFAFRKELRKISPNKLLVPATIFLVFFAIMVSTLLQGGAARAKDISVFGGALSQASEERTVAIQQGLNPTAARILHNKYQVTANRFLNNYTQYTSYRFLFTDGPAEATYGMIPGRGVLYWFELAFIIGFIYALFKQKERRPLLIVLFWILIAPIPAALTTGKGFAANRAAIMMPAVQILSAVGAIYMWQWFKETLSKQVVNIGLPARKRYALSVAGGFAYWIIGIIFMTSFIEDYFLLSPIKTAPGMLHGNLEAALWLSENSLSQKEIIVSKKLSEPHIYIAYAFKWNPFDYQRNTEDWSRYKNLGLLFVDMLGEYSLGKYTFRDIHYPVDQKLQNVLLVGRPNIFPKEVVPLKTIYYLDGEPSILIVDPAVQTYAKAL